MFVGGRTGSVRLVLCPWDSAQSKLAMPTYLALPSGIQLPILVGPGAYCL